MQYQRHLMAPPPGTTTRMIPRSPLLSNGFRLPDENGQCPPCFNCLLPAFKCHNFGVCSAFTGRCDCPAGFGGDDCATPLCGSLPDDNTHRPPRKDTVDRTCGCPDGWSGINCNVCAADNVCGAPLLPPGVPGTCYASPIAVVANQAMCDVTNPKILDLLGDDKPQVTLSCNATGGTPSAPPGSFVGNSTTELPTARCGFQFWIGGIESFYCSLDRCKGSVDGRNNATRYDCTDINCGCLPDRMLCGKDGSVDIRDFLSEEVRGPGSLTCGPSAQIGGARACQFTEPAMDQLISDIFGDTAISLACSAGECLHVSQIPGSSPIGGDPEAVSPLVFTVITIIVLVVTLSAGAALARAIRKWSRPPSGSPTPTLTQAEIDKLMADHVPATLAFADLRYRIPIPDSARRRRSWWSRSGGSSSPTGSTGGESGSAEILHGVFGVVRPGELLAIMGGSGAGKSTCLDILARRSKSGIVTGTILVNGRVLDRHEFAQMCGYIDQEDTLMGTLTVEETILYSALLRLPKDMSLEAKKTRVRETMIELGISHIAGSRVGDATLRGISGGEKRRVSIACELVTSPSVLFVDEPTSGLDAYNAHNVVECLRNLARNYNRTIVLTIHQPRSDIFAMFDRLMLLAQGRMVYSGPAADALGHFADVGFVCPIGFNVADYLIDLTVGTKDPATGMATGGAGAPEVVVDPNNVNNAISAAVANHDSDLDYESEGDDAAPTLPFNNSGVLRNSGSRFSIPDASADQLPVATPLRRTPDPLTGMPAPRSPPPPPRAASPRRSAAIRHINRLARSFQVARAGEHLRAELADAATSTSVPPSPAVMGAPRGAPGSWSASPPAPPQMFSGGINGAYGEGGDREVSQRLLDSVTSSSSPALGGVPAAVLSAPGANAGHWTRNRRERMRELAAQRAPLSVQFQILANRTFKNLYRNPYLLLTHYAMAVVVAILCGLLFWHVTADIAGFQNRMGCFFFVCALFGFSTLSSLQTFAAERVLFTRERANGYYSPLTYYAAKVLCDLVPLRVIPPVLLACIVYPMVGLVSSYAVFFKFVLVLVLFNVTAAALCLVVSLAISEVPVASLVASLAMLFSMLFGGLLLNKDTIPAALGWMKHASFFNYALEALVVNELKDLRLSEQKYGLQIEVPAAVILSTFGFNAQAYWADVWKLFGMAGGFLFTGYVVLVLVVKERR
ncbi:hypothetical protein BC828DRAFT_373293 [Blastocladiella britannica]|nr:hypothetical protein BC828DRAFT_373293 [Blastocladiella britannica]